MHYMDISIHAPARGATQCGKTCLPHLFYFNPRSRKGSDSDLICTIPAFCYFNPRSRKGSDFSGSRLPGKHNHFNPRSRKGSDQQHSPLPISTYCISIHAPARGATAKATILLRNENIYLVNTHNLLFPSSNYKYFRSGLVTFLWCEPPILLMSTYHSHQFISLMYLQPHKKFCFQNVQLLSDNYFPDNKTAGCLPSH